MNTGNAEKPAPALNSKKAPIKGANIQINQEIKFGLVLPCVISLIYQAQVIKFSRTPIKIIFSGNIN